MTKHLFESMCPGNDGRCQHGMMWGDRTDVVNTRQKPRCWRCAAGDTLLCTCN